MIILRKSPHYSIYPSSIYVHVHTHDSIHLPYKIHQVLIIPHQVLSHYLQVLGADIEAVLLVGSVPGVTDHIKLVGVDEDEV